MFLHGLFGKGQSFQFVAKGKPIQRKFKACHMVDMRNHGKSEWHPSMDYESLARDVHAYMQSVGIGDGNRNCKVTLVGHSLGAKAAMAFSCMFPHLVNRLVSLDASPVDRSDYPHLNQSSTRMIEEAIALGSLEDMPLESAIRKIKSQVKDEVLQTALLFNLNPDGSLQVNLEAISKNQDNIYGFPEFEKTFEGRCLMLNGAESFQKEILNDASFYNKFFPRVTNDDIVMLEKAGHGLHFEHPIKVRKLIHAFLL